MPTLHHGHGKDKIAPSGWHASAAIDTGLDRPSPAALLSGKAQGIWNVGLPCLP
jgi:hypothetical protein